MPELDRSRRYLLPTALDGAEAQTHLSVYGWEDRLSSWVAYSTSICGRSVHDAGLDLEDAVTCPRCEELRAGYEAVFTKEDRTPPVAERRAARKDPRYPAVLEEIRGFGWPAGNPMVPDGWADTLATHVMAAVRAAEEE
ncbi:hypothetical protein AB0O20_06585 [Streptomyces kronopolitis]|jgi:hypothetical protein|uniref:hypothetical protein n=1 Tax=Streptomyces kronopolitis TaxID=1612435 RepID=UPI003415BA52